MGGQPWIVLPVASSFDTSFLYTCNSVDHCRARRNGGTPQSRRGDRDSAQQIIHQLRCILVSYTLGRRTVPRIPLVPPVPEAPPDPLVPSDVDTYAVKGTKGPSEVKSKYTHAQMLGPSPSSDEEEKLPCGCSKRFGSEVGCAPDARYFKNVSRAGVGGAPGIPVYKKRRVTKTTLRLPGRKDNEVDEKSSSQSDYDDDSHCRRRHQ